MPARAIGPALAGVLLATAGPGWAFFLNGVSFLAVIAAANSVIAAYYYLNVAKQMWFMPAPDGDHSPVVIPPALVAAVAVTVIVTLVTGVTGLVPDWTDFATLAAAP